MVSVPEAATRIAMLERGEAGTLLLSIRAALPVEAVLSEEGRVPIPPYLGRDDDADDVSDPS